MFLWLTGVAVCVAIWGLMWRGSQELSFGVLLGVLLAWIFLRFMIPEVTGMEDFPVWLPPLPMATVAVLLFVYGAFVWFRGNDALPEPERQEHDDHGH
jgi:uncharacterized membrane protein YhdT